MLPVQSAIILVPDDRAVTGLDVPLMLRSLTGSPLLAWMVCLMRESGYQCFLLSCDALWQEAALACFPAGSVSAVSGDITAKVLAPFLKDAADQLLVVTAPALMGGRALDSTVERWESDGESTDNGCGSYLVSAESLASVMDAANFDLIRFSSVLGKELTEAQGAMAIPDLGSLTDMQSIFMGLRNFYLYADGVEIWDMKNCYVAPLCQVEPGAELLPGTILRGCTRVASGAVIGPNSLLEDAVIGRGAVVNASQIYSAQVDENAYIGPFACIRPENGKGHP